MRSRRELAQVDRERLPAGGLRSTALPVPVDAVDSNSRTAVDTEPHFAPLVSLVVGGLRQLVIEGDRHRRCRTQGKLPLPASRHPVNDVRAVDTTDRDEQRATTVRTAVCDQAAIRVPGLICAEHIIRVGKIIRVDVEIFRNGKVYLGYSAAALDREAVGILVGIIVGDADRGRPQPAGAGIKRDDEDSGSAATGYRCAGYGGHREVRGVRSPDHHRRCAGQIQSGRSRVGDGEAVGVSAARYWHAAKVGVVGRRGSRVPVADRDPQTRDIYLGGRRP